jgi:hypothetical protein
MDFGGLLEISDMILDPLIADQSLRGLVGEGFEIITMPGDLACIQRTK